MFNYEHVVIWGKITEDRAVKLLANLDRAAIAVYLDTFAKDRELTSEALDFSVVKNAMFERYVEKVNVEEVLKPSINARLSDRNLNESLRDMERFFEKAKFNEESKLGMLRSALMQQPKLAEFAISRGVTTFAEAKKSDHDLIISCGAFMGTRSSGSVSKSTQVPNNFGRSMHPKAISGLLTRSKVAKVHVGDKVDGLDGELAYLDLIIRKTTSPVSTQSDEERERSYYKKYVY